MRIGVTPDHERRERRWLFDALAEAYGVTFVSASHNDVANGPLITFVDSAATTDHPDHRLQILRSRDADSVGPTNLATFSNDAELHPALRSAVLRHRSTPAAALSPRPGDNVLASVCDVPVWVGRDRADSRPIDQVSAVAPDELAPGEAMRSRLRPGEFLGLVPLVSFVREVAGHNEWIPPAPRACIVIDDPNLRRESYGHLRFADLAQHAQTHGYHVAIAMPPIDEPLSCAATVQTFRRFSEHLSLVCHGNDHRPGELEDGSAEQLISRLEQAQRRIKRFSRHTGLTIESIQVPPHHRYRAGLDDLMLATGFDGMAVRDSVPDEQLTVNARLLGWFPADMSNNGLPVIPRSKVVEEIDDVTLRSFLGLPFVFYAHHDIAKDGMSALEALADRINRIEGVQWSSMGTMLKTNFSSLRRSDDTVDVRVFSTRVELTPSTGRLRIVAPPECSYRVRQREHDGGSCTDQVVTTGEIVSVTPGVALSICLVRDPSARAHVHRADALSIGSIVRRRTAELRDRGSALAARNDQPLRLQTYPGASTNNRGIRALFTTLEGLAGSDLERREFRIGRTAHRRCDIVHVQWPESVADRHSFVRAMATSAGLMISLAVAKARGAKVVRTLHDHRNHERRHPLLETFLRRSVHSLTDAYIVLSPTQEAPISSRGRKRPTWLIPLAPLSPAELKLPSREDVRIRLGLPEGVLVGTIGTIHPYKQMNNLVESFATTNHARGSILIAGENRDPAFDADHARSRGVLVRDEQLDTATYAALLRALDVVVLPYQGHLNSGVALDALSLGTRVIVTRSPAMADLAGHAEGWVRLIPTIEDLRLDEVLGWASQVEPQDSAQLPSVLEEADKTLSLYRAVIEGTS